MCESTRKNATVPCCWWWINGRPCSSAALGRRKPPRLRKAPLWPLGAPSSGATASGRSFLTTRSSVEIKPQRSRGNVLRICHELVRINGRLSATRQSAGSAALNDALRRAVNVAKHDHLVILITDYDGDDETTRELTTRLAAHNDVLAVLVYDPSAYDCPRPARWRQRTASGG